MNTVCKWTNAEGKLVYNRKWKTVKAEEFKKFIGLTILSGVYKLRSENIIQLWSKHDARPIFNHIMIRKRYQQILRILRFDDTKERRRNRFLDKLQPIREVFET